MRVVWWIMGIVAALLAAGVVGSIATFASVQRLDASVILMHDQLQRELDQEHDEIRLLGQKLDTHIMGTQAPPGRNEP